MFGSRESTRQKEMELHQTNPFCQIHWGKKIIGGVVGVTRHTHEICALPQEEVYENLLCNTSSSLVQRFRSWKETINNRVWLFVGLLSLSRTTSFLPWCIFFPLIFSSIKGKIKFTLRKVPNCQSEFFSDNFFCFSWQFIYFWIKKWEIYEDFVLKKLKIRVIFLLCWKKSPNFWYHKIEMKNPVFRHHPDRFWCSISLLFIDFFFFFFWVPRDGWVGIGPVPLFGFGGSTCYSGKWGKTKLNVSVTGPGRTYCNLNKKSSWVFRRVKGMSSALLWVFIRVNALNRPPRALPYRIINNKPKLDSECIGKKYLELIPETRETKKNKLRTKSWNSQPLIIMKKVGRYSPSILTHFYKCRIMGPMLVQNVQYNIKKWQVQTPGIQTYPK